MRNRFPALWTTIAMLAVVCGARAEAGVTVSPSRLELSGGNPSRQVLVTSDGRDASRGVQYTISNPAVATIDATGQVVARGDGETQLRVTMNGETAEVPVVVSGFLVDRPVDFVTEIEPLLTRYSCNSGGCHGKATGQNGFKLSLFGFNAAFDHEALVREGRGRRVSLSAPEESLLLTKATAQIPHGGGRRIEVDSEAYAVLLRWIKSGAPASAPDVPRVTQIEVEPAERILQPAETQQLRVTATYSDGSTRDVTRQTDYASNLDVVARVDSDGLATAGDNSGEAAIMARYMGQVAVFRAIRPHGPPLSELAEFSPITEIDRLAAEKWKKLGLRPSSDCDDATFLRRATIDLCGRLPTVDEAREFLADASTDKRTRLIDRLLRLPDCSAYSALQWSAILRNSNLAGSERAAYAFHNWIRDYFARNKPYDEFVRGIVAASGEWQDAPAINWYWQSRDDQLHMITADTAQLFLGIRLQCARCHHHPYERWGQEDYYGLAGFYARLGRKSFGEPPPYYNAPRTTTGERNPVDGEEPKPKYPDGEYVSFTPEQDPRHGLVDWMTNPENPYFAKAYVNRRWGHFFGRGLVQEVDDMRATNPPSNPEILDFLAREFVQTGYDMRHIDRLIVTSRLYQLSSEPRPENVNDQQNFARFYARRMIAEVLHDAVDQTCGSKTNFSNMSATARAIDLPHEGFGSYFMDVFDRPKRVTVCECERSPGATLSQVLLLGNSDEIENKLADGQGRIAKSFERIDAPELLLDELYLAAYSRLPSDGERTAALGYLNGQEDKRKGAEDILWTLLNSREFTFNH
jgi:hypothetical protein